MKPRPESRTPNPVRLPLLVEIGCEEIPARFLSQAQRDLGEKLLAALEDSRLLPGCSGGVPTAAGKESATRTSPLQAYSTPRRLVAYVLEVLAKQPDKVEEITGPPVRVAFDATGKPTRAAESFAEKNQARVTDLVRVTTPKGEYLAVKKRTRGRQALELLSEILPAVITGLSFPKSMYWVAKSGPRFVRPIRWILALLGEGKQARVIRFEIAGVKSGNATYGHRSLGQRAIRVRGFNDYAKKLRHSQVEFDPVSRRDQVWVEKLLKVLLGDLDFKVIPDKELEDWIVNSTEWPRAARGSFDERFLKLPREILITVMRDHQRYFAVEDQKGNLQPRFITVLNREGDPKGLIRAGHERVLTARFRDAEFFWQADQKVPFEKRTALLGGVTYQAQLGSYADKIQRMRVLAQELCLQLEAQGKLRPVDTERALRAVELSKCDLTTHMVQEFPELQGAVGGLYAQARGEAREVYEAVYDHYLPRGIEDRCPRTVFGALVSLADKIDSVVGGFAVGNQPTGSSDPFGIRRAGNGIVKVLLELRLPVSLNELLFSRFTEILQKFPGILWERPGYQVLPGVVEFFKDRLRYYLETVGGLRYDTVRAVIAAGWEVPLDALERAEALEAIRGSEDFIALSMAAKRIKNILAKSASADDWKPGEPQEALLKEEPERELYHAYAVILSEAKKCHPERSEGTEMLRSAQHDNIAGAQHDVIRQSLERIATLRPAVDRFFDKVLVMAEDRALRENRLRLLGKLDELFSSIAHLSEIAPDSANVDASTSRAGTRD